MHQHDCHYCLQLFPLLHNQYLAVHVDYAESRNVASLFLTNNWLFLLNDDGFIDDYTIIVCACINWICGTWLREWLITIHFLLPNAGWCIVNDTIVVCSRSIIPRVACINLLLPQSKMFLAITFTVAWCPLRKFFTCLTVNYISAFANVLIFSFIFTGNDVNVRW